MKEFFKNLLSDSGSISSKRFAGILALVTAISLGFIDTYGHKISDYIFDGFLIFAGSSLGLTIADNLIKSRTTPTDTTPKP